MNKYIRLVYILMSLFILSIGSCINKNKQSDMLEELVGIQGCPEKKNIQKYTDPHIAINTPKGFECFDMPIKVFIKYEQPVNGYTVKAIWFPDSILSKEYETIIASNNYGKAVLFFEKVDTSFYVNCTIYTERILLSDRFKEYKFKNNEIICLTSPETFYFEDVDFDGHKELIINSWIRSQRDFYYQRVYKITQHEAVLIATPPFNQIDGYTFLDYANKSITFYHSNGYCVNSYHKYRKIEIECPNPENSERICEWKLYEVGVNVQSDSCLLKVYRQTEDSFKLVKTVVDRGYIDTFWDYQEP